MVSIFISSLTMQISVVRKAEHCNSRISHHHGVAGDIAVKQITGTVQYLQSILQIHGSDREQLTGKMPPIGVVEQYPIQTQMS